MTINVHAGRGAGRFRDPWSIRRTLSAQGMNMRDVALKVGVNYTQVTETVKGIRNDRKVLAYLLEIGCSAKALSLPEDMKEAMR